MILLDANQSLLLGGIPLTDWIQAVGAIVAIVGVLWGFRQLYKDSREKQSQINVLTELAKESALQTKHFSSQVDEMIKGNKLQTEFISLFQRTVLTNEESIKIQHDKNELNKQQRKLNIKPIFMFDPHYIDSTKNSSIQYHIKNKGGCANCVECVLLDGNYIECDKTIRDDKSVLKNSIFMLAFKTTDKDKEITQCSGKFQLTYEDVDQNKYEQIIEILEGKAKINEPTEISRDAPRLQRGVC